MADMPRLGSGISLVARHAELRMLQDALDLADSGQAGAVLLSGDAGVGKSRLLTELLTKANDDGHAPFLGRCLDTAEAALPYLPFAEAIRQLAAYDTELRTRHQALARLLPDQQPRAEAKPAKIWGSCSSSKRCTPRSVSSRPNGPSCWRSRTCTGPTDPAVTCWPSCCPGSPRSDCS